MNMTLIIKRLREFFQLKTDTQVADLLGVTPANLCRARKRNIIPFKRLIPLAKANGISLDYLFSD